jgi:hypothetical protein
MFKVLYSHSFSSTSFERFHPWSRSKAVLVYTGPKGSRVLISSTKIIGMEVMMMEIAAEWLNNSPSLEFTRLMLRSIKDIWKEWRAGHESNLLRTLRFRSVMGMDSRQPPFAPNNGSRLDGYW